MPRIFGTNLLGILLATLAMFMLGWLWYGVLFDDLWASISGLSEAQMQSESDTMGIEMFTWGLFIPLAQVLGLSFLLQNAKASRLLTCVKICAIVASLIALPVLGYNTVYGHNSPKLLGLDFAYLLVGYCLIGVILSFFRNKEVRAD